jgi:hypothetical protein
LLGNYELYGLGSNYVGIIAIPVAQAATGASAAVNRKPIILE